VHAALSVSLQTGRRAWAHERGVAFPLAIS
jgi:hypothetical protein